MRFDIEKEKQDKIENFQKNLLNFLKEYKSAITDSKNFTRHSNNCGNLARKAGESFCKFIILDTDKRATRNKQGMINNALHLLIQNIVKTEPLIFTKDEAILIDDRLNKIRKLGNNTAHDNNIITSKYDLDEIKNNLLYLSKFIPLEEKFSLVLLIENLI